MSVEEGSNAESTPVDNGATPEPEAPVETPAEPEGEAPAPEADSEGGTQPQPEGAKDAESEGGASAEGESLDGELFFEGEQVSVTVPDDLKGQLEDSGVDVNKAVNELFAKDSDFSLSAETRVPLDEKYGKAVVDSYLSAIKQQNQATMRNNAQAVKDAEAANKEASEWSDELVGGAENWAALEEWAGANLEDSQIESFNRAMDSGDKWMQELAIRELNNSMNKAEGDTNVELISGQLSSNTEGSALSSQEYLREMTSGEFMKLTGSDKAKAQESLDARRRAGITKGI